MPEKLSKDGMEEKLESLDQMEAEFHRKLQEFTALAKQQLRGPNSVEVMDKVVSFLTQPIPATPDVPTDSTASTSSSTSNQTQ